MPVIPSRQQRLLLCILFLLLLLPVASLIQGWQWGLFLPVWGLSLWRALCRAIRRRAACSSGMGSGSLAGARHRLDPRSRILPGALVAAEDGGRA
jgi:toxin CptA